MSDRRTGPLSYGAPPTNPRYLAYAAESSLAPERALARDAKRYPGGRMTGFMGWVSQRWSEWDDLHGHRPNHVRDGNEHRAFDAWLEKRYR